ncbi:hypothetical protein [Psychroserpens sp.]|uniref:hypothetical protein n=1 Tax=Psychroserpens sp. TaxID=2020870 RepID=UPI001B2DA334|nr:hypothetical protein [Psychroserpens sp.]MBO6606281.1 hypothetical protein [Psychroserpens sp.]MBO6632583.1 hypothetical protein [Psychroserpens sp.]MBO6652985.1 hypothetical protein [Psychroserpens sp.]MBO6680988.1 hypothetical protein [Psychroserpens sp.]MBO6750056.1 hypothetical protein [Psychroserpens sp.]
MKRITMTVLVCLVALCSYGQETLELKVKKSSDLPLTAREHTYVIEINNTSQQAISFKLETNDVICENKDRSKLTELNREILSNDGLSRLTTRSIPGKGRMEFSVKISRKPNTPLATYNCLGIKAVTDKEEVISNTLVIETWIPDPKNFQ